MKTHRPPSIAVAAAEQECEQVRIEAKERLDRIKALVAEVSGSGELRAVTAAKKGN